MTVSPAAGRAHGVLVVDDEAKACKWFARRYGDEFTVLTAGSVAEALSVLLERGADIAVLLSDYRMPEQSGIDLLAAARLSYPHVVRVLMSAYADKDVALLAVNRGRVEQILEKPLDEALTRQVLREALLTSRQRIGRRSPRERRAVGVDETLGFLAHEVRAPLSAVSGYLSALRERHATGAWRAGPQADPDEVLRMIDAAQRRTDYAQALVTNFLNTAREASRSRAGKRRTAGDLVRALQHDYPFDAHERKRLQAELGEDFAIPAHQWDLLYLVLCTLLKNALQAQSGQIVPAPRIQVRLSHRPRLELVMSDNGPGLPAGLAHRLAREPVSGASGGTGMGLLFCRRAMAAIGGDITLGHTEGGGATVVLRFPETTTLENAS